MSNDPIRQPHTLPSFPDSRMELETAARQAVEQSFRGICFSDHYDFDAPEGIALFTFDVEKQQEEIETVQKKFPEIVLLRGAEVAYSRSVWDR